MTNRNRRSFVTAVGAAGAIGLAGCLSTVREWRDDGGEPSAEARTPDEDDGDGTLDLPGQTIEDFEDLSDWAAMIDAGSLEAETDDPYAGSQSARLSAPEDTEHAAVYQVRSDGIDLSDQNLSLAVTFTGRDQLHLSLELYAPNSRNAYAMERTLTGPTDRWVRVDFGTSEIDGDPDLTDVREIRLTARRRGDQSGSIDCRIDDLRAVDRPETGKVMLLFDGTLESHYEHALEPMGDYDFAGVEAVIYEALGESDRLTIDQLEALDDAGWDMAARPRTGAQYLHDYSPEEQEGAIRRTKAFLESRGFEDGARHFVTPRNVLGPETIDLVREFHEQAFRYGGGPNALPLTDPHNVGVFSGADGETTKRYVDRAAEYGQLAVLHFEHIGEDGLSTEAFEDLLEHVDDADIEVVTASELLEGS
ncbi:polysaccharide deacetylase family protein [Natronorubrum sp. DTA7]|uniref:polysaccharide deacetylase family protein n=1 Tax=Natronorubrum sp. DTA7 TaxID=3447016 RepID=UPI003F85EFE0